MTLTDQQALGEECIRARVRLATAIYRTDVIRHPSSGLLLKREDQQVTGSFKARGALNALSVLGAGDVVVGSSGNHGIAIAWAGQRLGISATVVMTRTASEHKRNLIRRLGGVVAECTGGNANRSVRVDELAAATGALAVSSYDHPLVVAGQASVGYEILEQVPEVRVILAPVGGGGLLAGIATAVWSVGRQIQVYGVEPVVANDTARSLAAGRRIRIEPPNSVCDGVLAQAPGEFTFPLIQRLVAGIIEVPEADVLQAMRELAEAGVIAEPTGALAYAGARQLQSSDGVVVVVSGGNVEPATFHSLTGKGATTDSPLWMDSEGSR